MSSTGEDSSTLGFTLLELMAVLAIAAMLVAFGAPALFGGRSGAEYKTAVRVVVSGLKTARNTALSTGRETTFTLDVEQRAYRVGNGGIVRLPRGVGLALRTAESETLSDEIGAIRFYPDGGSTGGFVAVTPEAADEPRTRVAVDWLTGRILVD